MSVKSFVRALLAKAGYHIEGIRYTPRQFLDPERMRQLELDDVICRLMFERGPKLTFLQVGAYDGVSTDPLRRYIEQCGWRGVMVEPQPEPAAKLKALYADRPEIEVVQAAVDEERGSRTMYTVLGADVPTWAGGMATFNRDHITTSGFQVPNIGDHIREIQVPCVVFDDLLAKLPKDIDLLQIDAEGFDGRLLAMFPFERVRPAIVHYESNALTRAEKEAALERLWRFGYLVTPSSVRDTLAVLKQGA